MKGENKYKLLTIDPFAGQYLVSMKHTIRYNPDDPKASDVVQITMRVDSQTLKRLGKIIEDLKV